MYGMDHAVAAANGKIYLIGGRNGTNAAPNHRSIDFDPCSEPMVCKSQHAHI
jgi:hypothetical protein